jgi:hypothetical protein
VSVRVVAIDWSGAKTHTGDKIWLAEAADGGLVRLERMPGRAAVAALLIDEAPPGSPVVVGLDCAFSMPAWFVDQCGAATAHQFWCLVEEQGEQWLAECASPFWGRRGTRKPAGIELFRRSERGFGAVAGSVPKSVFQIAGAGAVGTGSVRGMRVLRRLHDAGFSIWPFDAPRLPAVIEIYPRLFTGPVRKSDAAARARHLERYSQLGSLMRSAAERSEDAFDAAVSALEMWRHRDQLAALPPARDDIERIEGAIWKPGAQA